jgi:DNA-binding MarR family transcriptional regulator
MKAFAPATRIHSPGLTEMLDYQLYLAYRDCGYVTERICKREFRINRRRWRILATLAQGDGITVTDLAARADLDIAQTSRTIGSLAREGFLRRLARRENARLAEIVITDKGHTMCAALFARYREVNRQLLRGLTSAQAIQLAEMLATVRRTAAELSGPVVIKTSPDGRRCG